MRPLAPDTVLPSSQPPAAATRSPPPPLPRHNHSSTRSQDSSRSAPRYTINHFDTGGMPVSLWGMDRRDVWRTCFCFHVRTVTIFIGVWYLMIYILALSFHAALLMYEPTPSTCTGCIDSFNSGGVSRRSEDTMLPTPVSNIQTPKAIPLTNDQRQMDFLHVQRGDAMRNGPLTLVLDTKVILLTVCNMLITLLMVYGAVRGKPSYLMPFFVLRVFDFCIFCLTMVGYFSYLPNVTENIMNTQGMPFRDEFLRMDPQLLSFITLIFIVAFIAVKAYIIGVIWNCYKYLMLRNTVIRGVIAYRHDDPTSIMGLQQTLLPDLPDYETAVNDPRYAKKPPSDSSNGGSHPQTSAVNMSSTISAPGQVIALQPPPPYSVAIASEPVHHHLVIPMNNNNLTATAPPPQEPPKETAPDDVYLQETAPSSPVFVSVQSAVQQETVPTVAVVSSPGSDISSHIAPTTHHQ